MNCVSDSCRRLENNPHMIEFFDIVSYVALICIIGLSVEFLAGHSSYTLFQGLGCGIAIIGMLAKILATIGKPKQNFPKTS